MEAACRSNLVLLETRSLHLLALTLGYTTLPGFTLHRPTIIFEDINVIAMASLAVGDPRDASLSTPKRPANAAA